MGHWKLVSIFKQPWEHHNVAEDRTECDDLTPEEPQCTAAMQAECERCAARCGVLPWEDVNRKHPI